MGACFLREAPVQALFTSDSKSAFAWDWRLHELQKMNLVVYKRREGDTAPVGEVVKISSFDIGAEIHGGGAPGRKMSSSGAAVGRGGYVGAERGGR